MTGTTSSAGHPRWRRWLERARRQYAWVDHATVAVEWYIDRNVEFFSMKVSSRGLFLTVTMMVLLLYSLDFITSQMPGVNEIVIPTAASPDEIDLGAAVHSTLLEARSAIFDVAGAVTLIVSAVYTAKALRQGKQRIFGGPDRRIRTLQFRNLAIGLGLAATGVCSWLLTLGTAVRTAAWRTLLGLTDIAPATVASGKLLLIAVQLLGLTVLVLSAVRSSAPDAPRRTALIAAVGFAAFTTLLNFTVTYTYLGALLSPDTSGAVVLVLSLLGWVNIVVRSYLYALCWVACRQVDPYRPLVPQGV